MINNRGNSSSISQPIPQAMRKMVQSLKEIVNHCPELDIYAALQDSNMDPNEALYRLLSLDPFHEVKSKRGKRKETKDSTETSFRGGGSNASNRGTRSGGERYVGRGGKTQPNSSDSSVLQGKFSYKKENGTTTYGSSSSSASGVVGSNAYRPPSVTSNYTTNENKDSTNAFNGNVSASEPSSGNQPVWGVAPGKKSLADIVKMGRPQTKVSTSSTRSHNGNHHLVHSSPSTEFNHGFSSSENQRPKVSNIYTEPKAAPNEWPLIEPRVGASLSTGLETFADSQLHPDQSNIKYDRNIQHSHEESDEVEAEEEFKAEEDVEAEDDVDAEEDGSIENFTENHFVSDTNASRKIEDNSGDASVFQNDMYTNMGSYQSHNHDFLNEGVEDVGASELSETENLHHLSIQEKNSEASYGEASPSVIIPDHLQVQTADLSHLSFGSFGSGGVSGPFASMSSRSNIEEAPTEADASVIGHTDTRNTEYYDDKSIVTATDGSVVHRNSAGTGSYDTQEDSRPVLKQENLELAQGNHYAFPSSSTGYTFENSQQLNAALHYSQTNSQMPNLATFSNAMNAYTNSLPSGITAVSTRPARESEYSSFLMTQSMATKHGSTVSSISDSSISVAEALKTGFQSAQPTELNLSGSSVSMGPTLPQHLAVHPYSQPTLPLGPFANMIGYPFLPQSYTYMPSGFQQAFTGNSAYPQSLSAILPQYKNSVSVSSLPQSAAVPPGYGAFGSSSTIPGNYSMNPPAAPAVSTINYEDVLSSHYKDNNHLISLQQNENSAMWLHGSDFGSRTSSAVPASTYYSFQGQNQQQGGFRQGQQLSQNHGALGYPNFYHSQTGMSLEQQAPNPRDGSLGGSSQGHPKPSQQIWQDNY